jgi:ABC-type Na+ transport system ATPase subunit NatA
LRNQVNPTEFPNNTRRPCRLARRGRGRRTRRVGYLAQEIPLYRRLSAEDHIQAGAYLNPRWDDAVARARLSDLCVPIGQAVGTL